MKTNPPWLIDLVGDFWETLESKVPPEWLPKLSDVRGQRGGRVSGELVEYGCGNYGCVLPTASPDVVLKVTTDASETDYAARLSPTMPVAVTTEYYAVVALAAKHEGRPVAMLWREEAHDVGKVQKAISKDAASSVIAQHRAASRILLAYAKGITKHQILQPMIQAWLASLDAMAKHDRLRFVALGMKQCFAEQGVMFLDVHDGNLGRVRRDGQDLWVITDPGNVIRLEATQPDRTRSR